MAVPVARVVHLQRGFAHEHPRTLSGPLALGLYTLNGAALLGLGLMWSSALMIAMVHLEDEALPLTALAATLGVMALVYGLVIGTHHLHLLRYGMTAQATPVVDGRRVSWRFTTVSGNARTLVERLPDRGAARQKLAPCEVIYDPACEACAMTVRAFPIELQLADHRVTARGAPVRLVAFSIGIAVVSLLVIALPRLA